MAREWCERRTNFKVEYERCKGEASHHLNDLLTSFSNPVKDAGSAGVVGNDCVCPRPNHKLVFGLAPATSASFDSIADPEIIVPEQISSPVCPNVERLRQYSINQFEWRETRGILPFAQATKPFGNVNLYKRHLKSITPKMQVRSHIFQSSTHHHREWIVWGTRYSGFSLHQLCRVVANRYIATSWHTVATEKALAFSYFVLMRPALTLVKFNMCILCLAGEGIFDSTCLR